MEKERRNKNKNLRKRKKVMKTKGTIKVVLRSRKIIFTPIVNSSSYKFYRRIKLFFFFLFIFYYNSYLLSSLLLLFLHLFVLFFHSIRPLSFSSFILFFFPSLSFPLTNPVVSSKQKRSYV